MRVPYSWLQSYCDSGLSPAELAERRVAIGAQPRERDPHQPNCSNSRRSFSKNIRRSGMPWRRKAIRSMPMPKANP